MRNNQLMISVVDDEESVRKALHRLLGAAGFDVQTCASGCEFLESLELLESLKLKRPDCVVLDLHMPGLSGLEVQQRLVHRNLKLPVIMMTGCDDPGLREQARKAGVKAYLTKPLEERTLLEAIAAATLPGGAEEKPKSAPPEASPRTFAAAI